ncbi:MAG: response regulator transcription factor [Pirellulales bacterium]|nr:response regulator transcription factor [Pirellulales bacterium]
MTDRDMSARIAALSPRRREVFRLISLGCTAADMAAILGLSHWTIANHRRAVMLQLGCDKSILLARLAIKHGVSRLDETLAPAEKRRRGRGEDGWN